MRGNCNSKEKGLGATKATLNLKTEEGLESLESTLHSGIFFLPCLFLLCFHSYLSTHEG
jgi:hypothetical protein